MLMNNLYSLYYSFDTVARESELKSYTLMVNAVAIQTLMFFFAQTLNTSCCSQSDRKRKTNLSSSGVN